MLFIAKDSWFQLLRSFPLLFRRLSVF